MFVVSEEAAAATRTAYDQGGALSAAIEVRQRFPAITDNAEAQACARSIAGWTPLPLSSMPRKNSKRAKPGSDRR